MGSRANREGEVSVTLVEQNSHMAPVVSSCPYALVTGRDGFAGSPAEPANDDHARRLYLVGWEWAAARSSHPKSSF